MSLDPTHPTYLFFGTVAAVGFLGGLIGGVAGLGGSIIMLPGLAILLGYSSPEHPEQHLYMAAGLVANVAVAVPAALRHRRAGVVSLERAGRLLPSIIVGVVAGVLWSNVLDGRLLTRLLGGMIIVSLVLVQIRERLKKDDAPADVSPVGFHASGLSTGLSSGLLGIGGGVVLVTALRGLARTPIREAIGLSSTVMIVTAAVGAGLKLSTLPSIGLDPWTAGQIAMALAPGAIVGSMIGSSLVHTLPVGWVRWIVSVVMLAAAIKLLIG